MAGIMHSISWQFLESLSIMDMFWYNRLFLGGFKKTKNNTTQSNQTSQVGINTGMYVKLQRSQSSDQS